ncbi:inositol monophosphatase [Roseomonas sp. 18066]|uniref:inositol monophosphatase family protein n=1 Tax=Roseomonas sp. 18066 TaxID=2681412 RepID=UPI00135AB8A0|nr:inositol monophosphatase [Roseomonas sp. 18066]
MTDLADRLTVAGRLAQEAAAMALRLRPQVGDAVLKSEGLGQDWLTEADGAVERFLSDELAKAFPEDGFQGEEAGLHREGKLRWVVDPIDGTSNFAHGGQRWCVSIGLVGQGEALLGAICAPQLNQLFLAQKGLGATLNGAPIRVAGTTRLDRAMVECGWSPRLPDADYQALVQRVMGQGAMLRAGGSGTLGLADVAAGTQDAYVELHINLWDVAAALVVLAEAGARVNPFIAQGDAAGGAPILAATPALADQLSALSGISLI